MKTAQHNNARDLLVPLSTNDLLRICEDIASELSAVIPGGPDQSNFQSVLRAWRKFSPESVENERAFHGIKAAEVIALGGKTRPFDREDAEATRAMHDQAADLLEHLLGLLPAGVSEVSHG